MTDGDQLTEQATALRQARESLHAVLARHPDWTAFSALDAAGETAPHGERMRLEQALSGVPAFVALRQVDDALAQIEAEIERSRPAAPPPATAAVEPERVVDEPASAKAEGRAADAQVEDERLADDLTRIRGIDAAMQARLASHGVTRFEQIAAWWPADVRRFGDELGIGRTILRQSWVPQAELLMRQQSPAARPAAPIAPPETPVENEAAVSTAPAADAPAETTEAEQAEPVEAAEVTDTLEGQPPPATPARTTGLAEPLEIKSAQVPETPVENDALVLTAPATDASAEASEVEQAEPVEATKVTDALKGQTPPATPAPSVGLAEPLEIKFAQAPGAEASEPAEPIRLSEIIDGVPTHTPEPNVIEASFSPAPADGDAGAQMHLASPPIDTPSGGDAGEPAAPQGSDRDELAEILAMIRHSSPRFGAAPTQPATRPSGLKARIEAATEGPPIGAAPAEPTALIELATEGQRKMPALGEPERVALASLDRLAALESAVDTIADTDVAVPTAITSTEQTTPLATPLPLPAPEVHEAAPSDAEADVEILRRANPAPMAQTPRRGAETSQEPPAFVGAEEANVVIVRRAAGEAAPALPFYAHKPPETQSTVRRFMSALTGPAVKPPE